MVDKGIEVILNSTVWAEKTHSGAYRNMKELLGLEKGDNSDLGVIINTSMSPWLRAQATYKRLGMIIRNELYNAYGGVSTLLYFFRTIKIRCFVRFTINQSSCI